MHSIATSLHQMQGTLCERSTPLYRLLFNMMSYRNRSRSHPILVQSKDIILSDTFRLSNDSDGGCADVSATASRRCLRSEAAISRQLSGYAPRQPIECCGAVIDPTVAWATWPDAAPLAPLTPPHRRSTRIRPGDRQIGQTSHFSPEPGRISTTQSLPGAEISRPSRHARNATPEPPSSPMPRTRSRGINSQYAMLRTSDRVTGLGYQLPEPMETAARPSPSGGA